MGNLFASTGLGDEKPHERDVEYCGFAGRRPYERQNENPETPDVHRIEPIFFLVGGIHEVITHARFGDDHLRGSWVVWGSKFTISH